MITNEMVKNDIRRMLEVQAIGRTIVPIEGRSTLFAENVDGEVEACWLGALYVGLTGVVPPFHDVNFDQYYNLFFEEFPNYFHYYSYASIYSLNDGEENVGSRDKVVNERLLNLLNSLTTF